MLIKIISVINPTVSMGHYKRSILLKRILGKKNKVELFFLKKKPLKDLKKIYNINLKSKKFDYIILDISNRLIFNKKLIVLIDLLILNFKNKIVITDSLGKDAISPYLKKKDFILHLPYILGERETSFLKKKFKFNMLGFKYSLTPENLKKRTKLINQPYILLTFGASDKYNKSFEILKLISSKYESKILFVIGPYFKNIYINKIKKFAKLNDNIELVSFKKTLTFYLKKSKMIITNAGLTKYESINTDKPVMIVYENKTIYKSNKFFIKENLTFNFLFKKENIKKKISNFLKGNFDLKEQINNRMRLSYPKKNNFENYLRNNL